MKKLFALLLTVVMMASMMAPAMAAYTAITPGGESKTTIIPHQLQLTNEADVRLDYEITYSYVIENPVVIIAGATGNVSDELAANAVSGKPEIPAITYGPGDTFSGDNKVCEKTLVVDWKDVSIKEPGVYRWKVTQDYTTDAPVVDGKPSGKNVVFYLYMYVTDTEGVLDATFLFSTGYNANTGLPEGTQQKPGKIEEAYPAKTIDLTISKTVSGTQASKDQYFPFTITLTVPNAPDREDLVYSIVATTGSTYDTPKTPATAYHGEMPNPSTITLPSTDTTATVTVWLKHNQSVTINNLIYGTSYTIVEGPYNDKSYNEGYTVTATDENGVDQTGEFDGTNTFTDTSLTDNAVVAYKNEKDAVNPTGISLQSGAAFFGIVLAMGMMVLMFVGKRKEQN